MEHQPAHYVSTVAVLLCCLFFTGSCESETTLVDAPNNGIPDDGANGGNQDSGCPSSIGFVFEESNGMVSFEFEDTTFPEGWVLRSNAPNFSGDGYMQWEGSPSLGNPGNGTVTFPIRITTPGTYRFLWHSSFQQGNNGTEHNDSWLRFPDADDFFGRKGNGSVVYPNGSGKQPNPNGSSSEGWFKIYRSGNDTAFKWQASTSDNDPHDIYVTFSTAGTYVMEVAARSDFHAIDRILLYEANMDQNDAIAAAANFSQKTNCN